MNGDIAVAVVVGMPSDKKKRKAAAKAKRVAKLVPEMRRQLAGPNGAALQRM